MVISRIVSDKFDQAFEYPSEADVINAIHSLNGKDITMIDLFTRGEDYMTVAGGNDRRYICYITKGTGDEFLSLLNVDTNWNEKIEIIAGGNVGVYGGKHCLSLEMILKAVKYFAKYGTSHPDLLWETNSSLF